MLRDAALLLLVALGVVVAATWPAVLQGGTHLGAPLSNPDLHCGLWWPGVVARWAFDGEPLFFRPELAWPDGQDVTLLIWNFGVQLLFAPLTRWLEPIAALNATALGSMVLNGLVAGLSARWLTGDRWAGVAATAIGSASAYAFLEGAAGRPDQALWAPAALYLAALLRLREDGRPRLAVTAGLALAAAGAVYWFYAWFLLLLTALLALPWLLRAPRRALGALAVVGAVALLAVSPFLAPVVRAFLDQPDLYVAVKASGGDALAQQVKTALPPRSWLGPLLARSEPVPVREVASSHVAPLLALPLGILGLLARDRRRPLAVALLLALLFAAGPLLLREPGVAWELGGFRLALPGRALLWLPGYDRLWWPYRWLGPLWAALALLAGLGVARLRRRALAALLLAGLALAECALAVRGGLPPTGPPLREAHIPAVLARIGALGGTRPIVQLPAGGQLDAFIGYAAWHRQPIDGGIGWAIPVPRSSAYARRLREVPLLATLVASQEGRFPPARTEPWTLEETGGFHYVLDRPGPHNLRGALQRHLVAQLGKPFACNDQLVVWAVPGVGTVPPDDAGTVESTADPCTRAPKQAESSPR